MLTGTLTYDSSIPVEDGTALNREEHGREEKPIPY